MQLKNAKGGLFGGVKSQAKGNTREKDNGRREEYVRVRRVLEQFPEAQAMFLIVVIVALVFQSRPHNARVCIHARPQGKKPRLPAPL